MKKIFAIVVGSSLLMALCANAAENYELIGKTYSWGSSSTWVTETNPTGAFPTADDTVKLVSTIQTVEEVTSGVSAALNISNMTAYAKSVELNGGGNWKYWNYMRIINGKLDLGENGTISSSKYSDSFAYNNQLSFYNDTDTADTNEYINAKKVVVQALNFGGDGKASTTWVINRADMDFTADAWLSIGSSSNTKVTNSRIEQNNGTLRLNSQLLFTTNNYGKDYKATATYDFNGGKLYANQIYLGNNNNASGGATGITVTIDAFFNFNGGTLLNSSSNITFKDFIKGSITETSAITSQNGQFYIQLGGKIGANGLSQNVVDFTDSTKSLNIDSTVLLRDMEGQKGGLTINGAGSFSSNSANASLTGVFAITGGQKFAAFNSYNYKLFQNASEIFVGKNSVMSNGDNTHLLTIGSSQILSGSGYIQNHGSSDSGSGGVGNLLFDGGTFAPRGDDGKAGTFQILGDLNLKGDTTLSIDVFNISKAEYDVVSLSYVEGTTTFYFKVNDVDGDGSFGNLVFDISSLEDVGTLNSLDFLIAGLSWGKTLVATDLSKFNISFVGSGKNGDINGAYDLQNNQIVFTQVPEPSVFASIFGAIALGLAIVRRRKM